MWQDRRLIAAIRALPDDLFVLGDAEQMLRRALRAAREAATAATVPPSPPAVTGPSGLPTRRRTVR